MSGFELRLTKLVATLHFPKCELPYWLGNKFRGGFGNVLFRAVCGYLQPRCSVCLSREDCLYYELYVRDRQKRGKSQPVRPISFIPPFFSKKVNAKNFKLSLEINVFGDYVKYLPHIIFGLKFLGSIGLNRTSKYELLEVRDYFTNELVYDGSFYSESVKTVNLAKLSPSDLPGKIRIDYVTPIDARTPISLEHLIRMVRSRLIHYVNEYGKGEVPSFSVEDAILDSAWRRHKLYNRSKREGKRTFCGYTGYAIYEAELDDNARKLLSIGLLIGAGAKASFGMGHFKLSAN